MIEEGIKQGLIDQETAIIELTVGNTGIDIALAAQKYNLKTILLFQKNSVLKNNN